MGIVGIASLDLDGVIFMGPDRPGLYPGPRDIIITGRSTEEMPETLAMLNKKGIKNLVYFNPVPFQEKTRELSGVHKARVLNMLRDKGENIRQHCEDDHIQASIIKDRCPWIDVILIVHELLTKENVRHDSF